MVLVSLISKDNQSIVLSNTEKTNIGRGFFRCNDKRVSKNHGEITVQDRTVIVKSCSTNPIYYKRSGKDGPLEILRKDSEIILGNKDVFSLLPNDFEYTINIEDNQTFRVRQIEEINENLESGEMAVSLSQIIKSEASETASDDQNTVPLNSQVETDGVSSTSSLNSRKRSFETTPSNQVENDSKKIKASTSKIKEQETQPSSTSPKERAKEESNCSSDVTESANCQSKVENIKPDPDSSTDQIGPIDRNLPSTSSNVKSEVNAAVKEEPTVSNVSCQSDQNATLPPRPNLRPSCEFGIRCYRMTDQHRQDFAHPMDHDYRRPNFPPAEPGAPRCPFYESCYRRNPEHFRTMAHPSADIYTPQQPPQMQNNYYHPAVLNDQADDALSDEFSDLDDFLDDSDVDRDYEIDGSHSSYEDENNLEE